MKQTLGYHEIAPIRQFHLFVVRKILRI